MISWRSVVSFWVEVLGKVTEKEYRSSATRDSWRSNSRQQWTPSLSIFIGQSVSLYQIEHWDVPVGDYATAPNQPNESLYRSMTFKIKENDVLLKLSVQGAFGFVQLRRADEQWKVVAEY